MKNNTKIRLHLSKQLFEALTKQVLAEAKVNDGYSETVKQPKGGAVKENAPKMPPVPPSKPKMPPVPASKPKVPPVPPLKPKMPPVPSSKPKMPPVPGKMEEKMSSKEKMAKGLYKEADMEEGTQGSKENIKAGAKVHPHGQPEKVMTVVSPDGGFGGKVQVKDEKGGTYSFSAEDLELVEGDLNEISSEMDLLQQAAPILGTILGVGGTFLASYVKALKSAKTPKEKEELNKALRNQINKSKGF